MSIRVDTRGANLPRRQAPQLFVSRNTRGLNKTEKKQVKALVRGQSETKRYSTVHYASSIDYTGTMIGSMSPMAQGDAFDEREGDVVTLSKLVLRWNAVCATTTNTIRIILFRWKEDNATAPLFADIIQAGYAGGGSAPFAPLVFGSDRARFNVLWDHTVHLSQTSAEHKGGTKNIYLKNSKIRYNTGAITGRGNLYCLVCSGDGAVAYPQFGMTWELFYKDV